jgi:hypothetical protein
VRSFFSSVKDKAERLPIMDSCDFANIFIKKFQGFNEFVRTDTDGSFKDSFAIYYFLKPKVHCINTI